MSPRNRGIAAVVLAALLAGACGSEPVVPPSPSAPATPAPSGPAIPAKRPFAVGAWPADSSACDAPGYTGLLGRVEATSVHTVVFTLCRPDAAFPARLAHPALGIVDAAWVDAIAANPSAARFAPGAGAFRVESWTPGDNTRLVRVNGAGATGSGDGTAANGAGRAPAAGSAAPGGGSPGSGASAAPKVPPPVLVMRWMPSPADRAAALLDASVDGMDAPGVADAASMATLPELDVVPRPGLTTAYLGFGTGKAFANAAVRRAFAQAIDHEALARDAFPAGSTAATHLAPCDVPAGCAGKDWYAFNGPAATAALAAAGFGRATKLVLHVPDAPVPGLPDPAGAAAAVRDQLAASVGVAVTIDAMPAADLASAVASGRLAGLYLGAVTSSLADPSGFLEPLLGAGATGLAPTRAKGVDTALRRAARTTDPATRSAAFAAASDAIRAAAPIVPLVHAGTTAAWRADVTGVAVSPLGVDPLGSFVPADRHQLVVAASTEPAGAWCAIDATPAALRLCALVTPGLYAFDEGSLRAAPALASGCTAGDGARTWTCQLRSGARFSDGRAVDAGDVLASIRAQADPGSPLRAAFPATSFAAWDELFGG